MNRLACVLLLLSTAVNAAYFGVYIGDITSNDNLIAKAFIANRTTIQLSEVNIPDDINYTFGIKNGDIIEKLKVMYIVEGKGRKAFSKRLRNDTDIPENSRLVLRIPRGVDKWEKLVINDEEKQIEIASVDINKPYPEPFCCLQTNQFQGIQGKHYNVSTGPVTVLDSHTVRISKFAFDGTKAPDGWIFAGKGGVSQETGHKLQVLGRDEVVQCALHEQYVGDGELIARLPPNVSVYDIDYLAVFCYQYDVDFGHLDVNFTPEENPLPAYIPPTSDQPFPAPKKCD
ncbi:unnamed protein product [Bursaphelenchus okinawaensis]|uniref:DM13 domain-containing protein n=1 Tax=Bursaphelenchus okinawaensis TaxID=465554 RepID=A0A811KEV5_9BILA|nr:unnamed protein product [Bursaphelenchus okinawaensis]CAG9103343.1 unnamed protein product [Bursaphelenchus okinawaensis]